jgi:hypothetical protein
VAWLSGAGTGTAVNTPPVPAARPPALDPDYTGIIVPPNIAPLNFVVKEPGLQFVLKIRSIQGQELTVKSKTPKVIIPQESWREFLLGHRGESMVWQVSVMQSPGQWQAFAPITNSVAQEDIDSHLVYRLLNPQYSLYGSGTMGIFQRDLEHYDQSTIFRIRERDGQSGTCMNCHTFHNRQPYPMVLHIRSANNGMPMLVARQGKVTTVNRPMGYLAWHPNGHLIAFSMNKLSLFYHSIGEGRDVFDATSDLGIYRLGSNTFTVPPPIAQKEWRETWPGWSPDGRFLYYCRAPQLPIDQFKEVKYDLVRVGYDPDKDSWGTPEVLVSARDTGLSAGQPKVSPNGRFLVYCLSSYGNFPVYRVDSDLFLMDLETRTSRRMECNSDRTDSWHSWSSNSRWLVFSSKRRDGFLSRPHFSYIDDAGRASKPFLMPQADPGFYDSFVMTFNVPEFVSGPVQVKPRDLFKAVFNPDHKITPASTSPSPPTGQPAEGEDPHLNQSESEPYQSKSPR